MSDGEFQIPDEELNAYIPGNYLMKTPMEQVGISKNRIGIMTGIELITQERLDQKIKHNHSIKSDADKRKGGELGMAAQGLIEGDAAWIPDSMESLRKAIQKSYKDRLIIAGALIAAEIDRLNYKE
jgi:hypothetical protein